MPPCIICTCVVNAAYVRRLAVAAPNVYGSRVLKQLGKGAGVLINNQSPEAFSAAHHLIVGRTDQIRQQTFPPQPVELPPIITYPNSFLNTMHAALVDMTLMQVVGVAQMVKNTYCHPIQFLNNIDNLAAVPPATQQTVIAHVPLQGQLVYQQEQQPAHAHS